MTTIKLIHISCVALSFTGFFIRGIWMLQDSTRLQQRLTKILPHIIDTVLLVSAIVMAVQYSLNPLVHPWLLAKIIGLLFYIALGVIALKRGKTKQQRCMAWFAALAIFIYIAMVAVTKTPLIFT